MRPAFKKRWIKALLMNPDVKAELLVALRNGHYVQGKGKLRSRNCFCIMGVVCDLYHKRFPHKGEWQGDKFVVYSAPCEGEYLAPIPVEEWAYPVSRLMGTNDSGVTFETLANYIEQNY